MRFCDNCGTYLKERKDGLWCPRCKRLIPLKLAVKPRKVEKKGSAAVYVVNRFEDGYVKVSRTCPKCGNGEAYRWFSVVSGEHAGIRRERTVEHFKCTSCSHSWTKTS